MTSHRLKGKTRFTQQEAAELRRLIAEKQTADRSRQKTLRARMRAIGFYITDFATDQRGFVVSDFDDLITRGAIIIDGGETKFPPSSAVPRMSRAPWIFGGGPVLIVRLLRR